MKRWTISRRIVVGFTVVISLTIALAVASLFSLGTIQTSVNSLADEAVPGMDLSGQIMANTNAIQASIPRHVLATTLEQRRAIETEISALKDKNDKTLSEYGKTLNQDEDRALFNKLIATRLAYVAARKPVLEASNNDRKAEAVALLNSQVQPAYVAFQEAADALFRYNVKNGYTESNRVLDTIKHSRVTTYSIIAAVLLIAVLAASIIIIGISRVLKGITTVLDEGSAQVAAAAGQVSSASQSLAEGASEQAASLEETGSSLEEISSMTKRNAESAGQAKSLANQTCAAAETGAIDMATMTQAMDAIKTSSGNIAKIIKTIDEIAFQTNLLALNAAVEAARAGEAGAGFAVVADEVRSLAQRSVRAARETAESIEDSIKKSEHGVNISSKVAENFSQIVSKAREVDTLIGGIAQASNEQSQGISQVLTAVTQMDTVTQQNAGSAEESASAAEELNAQALTLKEAVTSLQHLVSGTNSTAANDSPPAHPIEENPSPGTSSRRSTVPANS